MRISIFIRHLESWQCSLWAKESRWKRKLRIKIIILFRLFFNGNFNERRISILVEWKIFSFFFLFLILEMETNIYIFDYDPLFSTTIKLQLKKYTFMINSYRNASFLSLSISETKRHGNDKRDKHKSNETSFHANNFTEFIRVIHHDLGEKFIIRFEKTFLYHL